jgi:phenylalanyl-tRNA synthetase alpha subunit
MDLDAIVKEALAVFAGMDDADQLEQAKARYLGRSGALKAAEKNLSQLAPTERPAFGSRLNAAKDELEKALREQRNRIQSRRLETRLKEEALDVTLPGRGAGAGGLHPVTRTLQRIEQLFRSTGFTVADGPEIETDYYNFTALNQPANHPARSMHDTFYLADGVHLLRTPHLPDPDSLHGEPSAADQDHRAGPGLPRGFGCHAFADVSPDRGPVGGRERDLRRPEGRADRFPEAVLRARRPPGSLSAVLLPVHRTLRRDRHELWQGLARDGRRRHGPSQRAATREHRQREVPGLCLRTGAGPADDAALRSERPAALLR